MITDKNMAQIFSCVDFRTRTGSRKECLSECLLLYPQQVVFYVSMGHLYAARTYVIIFIFSFDWEKLQTLQIPTQFHLL